LLQAEAGKEENSARLKTDEYGRNVGEEWIREKRGINERKSTETRIRAMGREREERKERKERGREKTRGPNGEFVGCCSSVQCTRSEVRREEKESLSLRLGERTREKKTKRTKERRNEA
jgi:hypothetical protein